jgi:hypothetical protein
LKLRSQPVLVRAKTLHLQLLLQKLSQLRHLQSVQTLELVTVQLHLANQLLRLKVLRNLLLSVLLVVNSMVSVQSVQKETNVRVRTVTVTVTVTAMETTVSVTADLVATTSVTK